MKAKITVEHEIEYEGKYCGDECKNWVGLLDTIMCCLEPFGMLDEEDDDPSLLLRCETCLAATAAAHRCEVCGSARINNPR